MSSCRHVHSVNNCHLSMNVVTQLTQFVCHDIINKNTTDLLRADWLYAVQLGQLSWVELCRYKRAFSLQLMQTEQDASEHQRWWRFYMACVVAGLEAGALAGATSVCQEPRWSSHSAVRVSSAVVLPVCSSLAPTNVSARRPDCLADR